MCGVGKTMGYIINWIKKIIAVLSVRETELSQLRRYGLEVETLIPIIRINTSRIVVL